MEGFYKAQQEYERHLTAPYDVGGALYDEDDEEEQEEQEYVRIWINRLKRGNYADKK